MYVTRPLSIYSKSPNSLTEIPEGPNSGILVVQDNEAERQSSYCFGLFKISRLFGLPLPQSKMIEVRYSFRLGHLQQNYSDDVFFIPVINHPLSSNCYYVVRANGKNKGKISTCSKVENASTSCFCTSADDVQPLPFDHKDIYQQVKIISHRDKYFAKSVASDGVPPQFLRRKNWRAIASEPLNFTLGEALGMNNTLRAEMIKLDFPISAKYSPPVVVGKWYCPYMFIKEGEQLIKEQMRKSMFYEMTLEQLWEEIYTSDYCISDANSVRLDVSIVRETALLHGSEIANEEFDNEKGLIWFKPANSSENSIGLSLLIWERMRWEEERVGWISGEKKIERVERTEIYEGENRWNKFGCYVLVERFVLRKQTGSVVLTCEFKHTDKVRVKWE